MPFRRHGLVGFGCALRPWRFSPARFSAALIFCARASTIAWARVFAYTLGSPEIHPQLTHFTPTIHS